MWFDDQISPHGMNSVAKGEAVTLDEIAQSAYDSQVTLQNFNSTMARKEEIYDSISDDVFKISGKRLDNPVRANQGGGWSSSAPKSVGAFGAPVDDIYGNIQVQPDHPEVTWQKSLKELAAKHPELNDYLGSKSADEQLRAARRAAEGRAQDIAERNGDVSWNKIPIASAVAGATYNAMRHPLNTGASFAGGLRGMIESPLDTLGLMAGLHTTAGTSLLKAAAKNAITNAGVQTASEPGVQLRRKDAGLEYGIDQAAVNILGAGAIGGAIDFGIRAPARVIKKARGVEGMGGVFRDAPKPDGTIPTTAPTQQPLAPLPGLEHIPPELTARIKAGDHAAMDEAIALTQQTRAAEPQTLPEGITPELVTKAEAGDLEATREILTKTGELERNPAARGALLEAEMSQDMRPIIEGVDNGDGHTALLQMLRAASDPDEPMFARAPLMHDPEKLNFAEPIEGRALGSNQHETVHDVETAQAKRRITIKELDLKNTELAQGVRKLRGDVERLGDQATFDRERAGRVLAFERADGVVEIVDGAARQALAKRFPEGETKAESVIFKERDGWTRKEVEREALRKNITEGQGSPLAVADAMRAHPGLLDGSIALDTDQARLAYSLSQLSDQAYASVKAGEANPTIARVVADHVANPLDHADVLADLTKMGVDDVVAARRLIPDLVRPRETGANDIMLGIDRPDIAREMPLDGGSKMDDPTGPQAKAQVMRMEKDLAPEIKAAQDAGPPPPTPAERIAHVENVRKAIEELTGIIPKGLEVRTFSSAADLPAGLARQVEAANAQYFAKAFNDFLKAKSESARAKARANMDAAKMGQGIEGIASDGAIYIAAYAVDPKGRIAHEVVHALRESGQIAPEELTLLADRSRKVGAFDAKREALYRGELEARGTMSPEKIADTLNEEAAAHLIEARANGKDFGRTTNGIIDRIRATLERVGNAVRGIGFKTADDVVSDFMAGHLAKREATRQWMRSEDVTAVSQVHPAQMIPGNHFPQDTKFAIRQDEKTGKRYIEAFHGTPHDFPAEVEIHHKDGRIEFVKGTIPEGGGKFKPLDGELPADVVAGLNDGSIPHKLHAAGRFSLDKIGTGEGAQAYGHGLYFADSEGVAKSYRDALSYKDGGVDGIAQSLVNMYGGDWKAAASKFERDVNRTKQQAEAAGLKYDIPVHDMETLAALQKGPPGKMYQVRINADPEHFLDWDKPLSEQSAHVKPTLERMMNQELERKQAMFPDFKYFREKGTLEGVLADDANHQAFLDAGIPGIKYLDQGSRTAGEGSRNYVVFSDDLIEITHKDGKPVESKERAVISDQMKPKGQALFAFAGERARTADHDALAKAKKMTEDGVDRTEVWTKTGWFRGVDGKWRFEIDDSGAKFSRGGAPDRASLVDLLNNPNVYTAYPDMEGIYATLSKGGEGGTHDPSNRLETIRIRGAGSADALGTGLHETQHAVQTREAMARGGSPSMFSPREVSAERWRMLEKHGDVIPQDDAAFLLYHKLAGETEARTVQKRMDLTADERRARPPWLDYDVPEDQQIVRFGQGQQNSETLFAMRDADTGQSMRRDLDSLGYYSHALEVAKSLKQAKGTPEQMLAQLKSAGVKQSEIEATNLAQFLDGKKSVTRDEIASYLETNRVGVKEVVRARKPSDPNPSGGYADPMDWVLDENYAPPRYNEPRWQSYSLDHSNPTYRETVLHLPEGERLPPDISVSQRDDGYWLWDVQGLGRSSGISSTEAGARQTAERSAIGDYKPNPSNFRSGHFHEPNIIGHMMTSMTKHEGRPVYTIDQIQSDWGQKIEQSTREALARKLFKRSFDSLAKEERQQVSAAKASSERPEGVRDETKIAALKEKIAAAEKELKQEAIGWTVKDTSDPTVARMTGQRSVEVYDPSGRRASMRSGFRGTDAEAIENARQQGGNLRMLNAELKTLEASTPGHPLVNTTDQWTTTTLRRAIRQAAEAGAEYIAIPSGDTVLSYNPGDTHGMHSFYGRTTERQALNISDNLEALPSTTSRAPVEGIVPKNLRKLLQKLDPASPKPQIVETLDTTSGAKGKGFTLFPLTEKVRQSVKSEGQALFAMRSEPKDDTPERIGALAQTYQTAARGLIEAAGERGVTAETLPDLMARARDLGIDNLDQLAAARTAAEALLGPERTDALMRAITETIPMLPERMPEIDPNSLTEAVSRFVADYLTPEPETPKVAKPEPANDNAVPTPLRQDLYDIQRMEDAAELVSVCRA